MDKQLSSVSEMSYATFLILCTRLITDKEFITWQAQQPDVEVQLSVSCLVMPDF